MLKAMVKTQTHRQFRPRPTLSNAVLCVLALVCALAGSAFAASDHTNATTPPAAKREE